MSKTHIVSIGGGLSSTIELPLEVIRIYGKENVVLVTAALKGEHQDLYKMLDICEQMTGLTVTRVYYNPDDPKKYSVGNEPEKWRGIWDVFHEVKFIGNSRVDPCSRLLKRETIKRWIQDNYKPEDCILHVGITRSEIDRTVAIYRNWNKLGYEVKCVLSLIDDLEENTTAERALCKIGFVPELYKQGFTHNNCGGFCVKAGKKHLARLLWYNPQLFFYHAEKEYQHQQEHDHSYTVMKNTVKKEVVSTIKCHDIHTDTYYEKEITETKRVSVPLTMYDFALDMMKRWQNRLLPPFDYEDLDETTACKFCESMA